MANIIYHQMDYSDLKELYIQVARGEQIVKLIHNKQVLANTILGWKVDPEFYGATMAQMLEWLHKGYHQQGLTLEPPLAPVRRRRRVQFGDEGELQVDLALSGYDYPFLSWGSRDVMPGMRVDIRTDVSWLTKQTVITEYYEWVLRALIAFESAGVDLEVNLKCESVDLLLGTNAMVSHKIRVKKEGEQTDFLSWSPMLSPGGFRHLMFLNHIFVADVVGRNVKGTLGSSTNGLAKWSVKFDSDINKLDILCPYAPISFPVEDMERQLREVLSIARRTA